MSHKLGPVTHSQVTLIAEGLKELSEKMTAISSGMRHRKIEKMLIYWIDRTDTAWDVVKTAINLSDVFAKTEFGAKDEGRPTPGEKIMAARNKRQNKGDDPDDKPKRGPGRPKKPKA